MRRLIGLCLLLPSVASAQPPAKYAEAIKALETLFEKERQDAGIPGISVAIVEGDQVIWAKGFGHADLAKTKPATADTVYRTGAVPLLGIAALRFVDRGKLDLDQPVSKYLPDFKPDNPFKTAITVRHLLSHRSGLPAEPPVGHYADATGPSLEKTVASLNGVRLRFEPGTDFKHSDAARAVVARVLEVIAARPFAAVLHDEALAPLQMKASAVKQTPAVKKAIADGLMWTAHGRETRAPTFDLGVPSVGCMYTTATDLARLASAVLSEMSDVLTKASFESLVMPHSDDPGRSFGFAPGFYVRDWQGHRRVGTTSTVYGFTSQISVLPADKLAIVVLTNKGPVDGTIDRLASACLTAARSARAGTPLPKADELISVPRDQSRKLSGKYAADGLFQELLEMGGKLYYLDPFSGVPSEVWRMGERFVTRGPLDPEQSFMGDERAMRFGAGGRPLTGQPKADHTPLECDPTLRTLLGEYGWNHNTIQVFEKDGRPHVQIDGFSLFPLEAVAEDIYRLPKDIAWAGDAVQFRRGPEGRGRELIVGGVTYPRRVLDGEDGKTFRIKPLKTMDVLRGEADAAKPPGELGEFRKPDLVELVTLDPTIKTDLRYASDNNFMGRPLYPKTAKAYMQRPAAEAVVKANQVLAKKGYGLWVFDAYRPWRVTKMFWEATPDAMRTFVADPSKGSRHNRGCAVDLTLYDLKTGKPVEMVSGYDEFSDRAYPNYWGGTSRQRWHRELLRHAMEDVGFTVYEAEWWHFDYKDWKQYRIGNQGFEELSR